jgi:succinate dehydrogenase/fumarate reductase cytochrome b subunit
MLFGIHLDADPHMLGGVRHLIWDTGGASARPSANG